jgi:hypothetical protein
MSLIYCPECGHEVSSAAVACPNCGRPLSAARPVEAAPVVAHVEKKDRVPNWIFIPLGIIGAVLLIVLFVVWSRNSPDDNSNIAVNVAARRAAVNSGQSTTIPSTSTNVPSTTSDQSVTIPGSQTDVSLPPARGTVTIDAKISTPRSNTPQPVKNERFYLLDKDLETILADARLEPIEGQTLTNSFGLSVVYPDRFGDFHRDALRAIKDHIKYAGTTDAAGKAKLGDIEPNSYYLFGVTRSGRGFAIWSSPVSIIAGENALNLSPQMVTDVQTEPTGE